MKRIFIILSLSICVNALLIAQGDMVYLSKNFKFQDGIFLSFEDFKNNKPTYKWKEVLAGVHSNPQNFLAQMYGLKVEMVEVSEEKEIQYRNVDLESIWGICLDGIPYIRLSREELKKENVVFAGMKLRGKICYYEYEEFVIEKKEMSAYNPVTGYPFRTKDVDVKVKLIHQNMLHFETGETAVFSKENFKEWIKDDKRLYETVSELSTQEVEDKLFKCLLIYDDRNLVKVRKK
ncbi:MAG: hypothetical protein P8M17_11270 [Saprospiraceae bacterium]|nr:hypothetical protein [Saprospiraceae bacterium]MDG2419564.1 hypothetical protein [Saprospiraceae bacterium]